MSGVLWNRDAHAPDLEAHPSQPDPLYEWEPGQEIPTVQGNASDDQHWTVCFFRSSRHMEIEGDDNTFASKVNRMIRAAPMRANAAGSEGWSFRSMEPWGYEAFGPKAKLSLRARAAHSQPMPECDSVLFPDQKGDPKAYAVMRGRPSDRQFTQIDGSRRSDWARLSTTDNTVATKIRKLAAGNPDWRVFRDPEGGGRLICLLPKGCVSFRR